MKQLIAALWVIMALTQQGLASQNIPQILPSTAMTVAGGAAPLSVPAITSQPANIPVELFGLAPKAVIVYPTPMRYAPQAQMILPQVTHSERGYSPEVKVGDARVLYPWLN
jgi:hypothetical protein